ncbi:PIN domain-containing protein [Streptomyces prunicolor]|uniref:PIN domain-containing protein n=1 Tax=Streptomyces prunicolor TaxID=67348 RepID=UPI0037D7FCFF
MPNELVVVVDTSAFYSDLSLKNAAWESTLLRSSRNQLSLWIPEIVLREAVRHYARSLEESIQSMRTGLAPLRALRLDVGLFPSHKELDKIVRERADGFEERLRSKLIEAKARFLPLPSTSHEKLLTRALLERKPFRNKGQDPNKKGPDGYRDALIWESVIEATVGLVDEDMLIIVTNNHKDFCDRDDENLSTDLLADLPSPQPAVKRFKDLQMLQKFLTDSLAELPAKPTSDNALWNVRDQIRAAVTQVCQELFGASIADPDHEQQSNALAFEDIDLPSGFKYITVESVDPNIETLSWSSYDSYESGPTLALIAVDAHIQIDGFMDKLDYHDSSDSVDLHDGDWNDHTVWAYVERDVRLTFHAAIDLAEGDVELKFENGRPA